MNSSAVSVMQHLAPGLKEPIGERLNQAILNQAVTTDALPLSHRAHPPEQRVRSPAPLETLHTL